MQPDGLQAFEARIENRTGIYSYEQRPADLPAPYARRLRERRAAWRFFQAQSPSYRKAATWWIVSAKQETTRLKRLEKLADCSAQGLRVPEFAPRAARSPR
jgi:uncharacterized protein YdeI (YjbR/CyaY-like superfamily)